MLGTRSPPAISTRGTAHRISIRSRMRVSAFAQRRRHQRSLPVSRIRSKIEDGAVQKVSLTVVVGPRLELPDQAHGDVVQAPARARARRPRGGDRPPRSPSPCSGPPPGRRPGTGPRRRGRRRGCAPPCSRSAKWSIQLGRVAEVADEVEDPLAGGVDGCGDGDRPHGRAILEGWGPSRSGQRPDHGGRRFILEKLDFPYYCTKFD